jgi:hypothetical protein
LELIVLVSVSKVVDLSPVAMFKVGKDIGVTSVGVKTSFVSPPVGVPAV